jgi:hypothetical protein
MKRWLKRAVILIAVLNLMLLTAAAIPVHATGDGEGASQGTSVDSGSSSEDGGGVPTSCHKCAKCHGFWSCLKWCAKCIFDILA